MKQYSQDYLEGYQDGLNDMKKIYTKAYKDFEPLRKSIERLRRELI